MTHATQTRTGTLDDIAPGSHVFSIIAMDQRNTLRRMFTAAGFDASDDDLRTAKADVARVLTPAASGLLSDPTYGVPAITGAGVLAPSCGLLVAAGGWTQMASVRAAKAAAIDAMSFSAVVQPGVTGAALLASFALDGEGMPLADFILDQGQK